MANRGALILRSMAHYIVGVEVGEREFLRNKIEEHVQFDGESA